MKKVLQVVMLALFAAVLVYMVADLFKDPLEDPKLQGLKIRTFEELEAFTGNFYSKPDPDKVESALRFIDASNLMENRRATGPLSAFFSYVFHQYPDRNAAWSEVLREVKLPVRVAFLRSMNLMPQQILAEQPLSPMKNDMYWALFYASGDTKYIDRVVDLLKDYDQDKKLNAFLTAGAAKWTLAINFHKNSKVQDYLKMLKQKPGFQYEIHFNDIFSEEPAAIHKAVLAKANANKSNKLWE